MEDTSIVRFDDLKDEREIEALKLWYDYKSRCLPTWAWAVARLVFFVLLTVEAYDILMPMLGLSPRIGMFVAPVVGYLVSLLVVGVFERMEDSPSLRQLVFEQEWSLTERYGLNCIMDFDRHRYMLLEDGILRYVPSYDVSSKISILMDTNKARRKVLYCGCFVFVLAFLLAALIIFKGLMIVLFFEGIIASIIFSAVAYRIHSLSSDIDDICRDITSKVEMAMAQTIGAEASLGKPKVFSWEVDDDGTIVATYGYEIFFRR